MSIEYNAAYALTLRHAGLEKTAVFRRVGSAIQDIGAKNTGLL